MSKKSPHRNPDEVNAGPRARPIHHSWIFWVGVALTLAAILTYVLTMDLATRPVPRSVQPTPSTVTTVP